MATEQERAEIATARGKYAARISDPELRRKYIDAQGRAEAGERLTKMGPNADEVAGSTQADYTDNAQAQDSSKVKARTAAINDASAKVPGYKDGTDRVPNTGPAILHKDETVLKKSDADKYRAAKANIYSGAAEHMGGEHHQPAKHIKEIRTRKAKNGGYIHEHHHERPDIHPMEEHTSPDQDSMVGHMMDNMGQANPGEADADAGMGGAAAPAPATGAI